MTILRSLSHAVVLSGAIIVGAVGFSATGSADPAAVPPAMLNTTCSLDQIMAATKAVDPLVYGAVVDKYNSEPGWVQGGVVYHMNLFLQKNPEQRLAEIDELTRFFPEYAGLFQTAEPTANAVAAKCPTFPAEDPAVWNAAAPAPVAAPAPATAATPDSAPAAPAAPAPATAAAPGSVPAAPAAPAALAAPAAPAAPAA